LEFAARIRKQIQTCQHLVKSAEAIVHLRQFAVALRDKESKGKLITLIPHSAGVLGDK
jgi:hypothetical protein